MDIGLENTNRETDRGVRDTEALVAAYREEITRRVEEGTIEVDRDIEAEIA